MANTANYMEQGGEKWVVGGTLEVASGAKLDVKSGATFTGFPVAENQAASTATTVAEVKADLNALLTKLKTAGLMTADA